jgi:hypothetical protein
MGTFGKPRRAIASQTHMLPFTGCELVHYLDRRICDGRFCCWLLLEKTSNIHGNLALNWARGKVHYLGGCMTEV